MRVKQSDKMKSVMVTTEFVVIEPTLLSTPLEGNVEACLSGSIQ